MSSAAKGWMLGLLALCFISQTYLVYSDPTETRRLEDEEIAGRRVWLANNCQACHQLYGFGGFLGPDLTNAASRLQPAQLVDRLALGEGQMPKFELPTAEIDALWSFLVAMDQTGIGQARNPNRRKNATSEGSLQSPRIVAVETLLQSFGSEDAKNGFDVYRSHTCLGCHVFFGESAIGAPDLSLSGTRLSAEEIQHILEVGIAPTMPPSGLPAEKRKQVQVFLTFLAEHREEALELVANNADASFWTNLPWWEF